MAYTCYDQKWDFARHSTQMLGKSEQLQIRTVNKQRNSSPMQETKKLNWLIKIKIPRQGQMNNKRGRHRGAVLPGKSNKLVHRNHELDIRSKVNTRGHYC